MLTEVRKILFPIDSLQSAFVKVCKESGTNVPNSQIQDIKIEDNLVPKVILQFVSAKKDAPIEIPLNEEIVLTAMIITCKEYSIPLPRNAKKTIEVKNNDLVMVISQMISKK